MSKRIAVMQPYFFPYIGYFQLIQTVDYFLVYDLVTFRKKSWITRNRLLDKGTGEPFMINMPTEKQSSFKLISEIKIDWENDWAEKLEKRILFNYKKAPHFEAVFPLIQSLLNFRPETVGEFNFNVIKSIAQKLEIKTQISYTTKAHLELEQNLLSNSEASNIDAKKQRVIDICKLHNCTAYRNPENGQELYDVETFEQFNIKLDFLKTAGVNYNQFNHDFEPHLSTIDVLFHNGFQGTKELLNLHTIIQ